MSKERARRRAEREAAAAVERVRRARARARRHRLRRLRDGVLGPLAPDAVRRRRRRTPDSLLLRRRRRENGVVLAVLVTGHLVLWLLQPSWLWRISALVLTVLAWPVLTVMLFDRRSSN
jgi:hypothetical protein